MFRGRLLSAVVVPSLTALAGVAGAVTAGAAPQVGAAVAAVSPGGAEGVAEIEGRCPTFSWSAAPEAAVTELVVFRAGETLEAAGPVLKQILPAGASSWTPSVDLCLTPGLTYGWSVRQVAGAWAAVRLFRVADRPSLAEVEEALAVLRRHSEAAAVAPPASPAEAGAAPLVRGGEPRSAAEERSPRGGSIAGAGAVADATRPPLAAIPRPAPAVTPPAAYSLSLSGDVSLGGFVFRDGVSFLHDAGGAIFENTALGRGALANVEPANAGFFGLHGSWNTALGAQALVANTKSSSNTAVGARALVNFDPATVGPGVYPGHNVAVGANAMALAENAQTSVAIGDNALQKANGTGNIAIGRLAGSLLVGGSNNIYIGHPGAASDEGIIRLGNATDHQTASIAGDVGIGTESPQNRLRVIDEVGGDANSSLNHVAFVQNVGSGGGVLGLWTDQASPPSTTNFITFFGNAGAIGAIEGNGSGGVTLNSTGADFAEYLPKLWPEERLQPGDVVGLHGDRVSRATGGADGLFVVTTAPLILGARPRAGAAAGFAPVAFLGQVPVRVRGPVAAGDVLLASGAGDGTARGVIAEELMPEDLTWVVGTALESFEGAGEGLARALVGVLPAAPLARTLARGHAELVERLRRLESGGGV